MAWLRLSQWPGLSLSFLLLLAGSDLLQGCTAGAVISLTGDTFDAAVKANPLLFVQFYAPWCQHCRALAPEFEAAAQQLQGKVPFARIDATTEVQVAERYHIDGYPTIALFRGGQPEEYSGARTAQSMSEWLLEAAGPALKVVQSEAELSEILQSRGSRPAFVAKGAEAAKAALSKVADEHRILGRYVFVDNWDGQQTLEVHRGLDEVASLTGDEAGNPQSVMDFLMEEMLPLFGEINEDNFEGYLAKMPQGMLWVCFQPESWRQDAKRYIDVFREVAEAVKFPIVYTDTKEFQEHVKEELGCVQFPTVVLQLGNLSNEEVRPVRYKTVFFEDEEITAGRVRSFVDDVLAGKVEEDDGLEELDLIDEEPDEEEWEDEGEDGWGGVTAEAALAAGAASEASGSSTSDQAGDARQDL
mmetsp:Transcript_51132/g.121501  ORF Transcript_51132/g.121501 Transcript_51132/m.121501 type:complete len:415 (+) Transcript_51132:68-1312(+)